MNDVLKIEGLMAKVSEKEILKGVDLEIKTGEVHAIMGPNGTGKSTLSSVIMGSPKYEVTAGSVKLNGDEILSLPVDERARRGIFLAYQYPAEIEGVTNSDFIRSAMKATSGENPKLFKFIKDYDKALTDLKMREDLGQRFLNVGFSGGEKKRNEVLQLKMLKPKFAILDEIDSGLDVDALRIVGENVYDMVGPNMGVLLITHYQRLLEYIKPTHVHVMINGRIVMNGGPELIERIDKEGYDSIKRELGIEDEKEAVKAQAVLGSCAHNQKK